MATPKTGRKASAARKETATTEAMVLALLEQNPYTMYTYTLVAQRLNCSAAASLEWLEALAKRGAIQRNVNFVGMTVFQARLDGHAPQLQRIVERGELQVDYNGARRHWELAMATRRS